MLHIMIFLYSSVFSLMFSGNFFILKSIIPLFSKCIIVQNVLKVMYKIIVYHQNIYCTYKYIRKVENLAEVIDVIKFVCV